MFWALRGPQKPKAMSLPSDLQAWFREDWKQDAEKPPNPLHLEYTFPFHPPVCCPCMKASVLLALGPLPPGCPPVPVPFLAGTTQPYSGSCGGPRMGEPPSCACVQLCQAACRAFAPVHAPCPSPLGEGLEGHLPTPRASLLALCAGGGCLWGERCSCRQGAGSLDCPERQPAQALAEAALLVHSICVQVLLATG